MIDRSLVDYIIEDLLGDVVALSARAMFGGFGLYLDGVIVGIIYQGELYLKVDQSLKSKYETLDSKQFIYQSAGKKVALPYMAVPADILEDKERLLDSLQESLQVSLAGKNR